MAQIIEAIYENGVLRPIRPLRGIPEHTTLRITIEAPKHPLIACIGSLPDEDADEMRRIIEDEFERVNPDEW